MISKTIGYNGVHNIFRQTQMYQEFPWPSEFGLPKIVSRGRYFFVWSGRAVRIWKELKQQLCLSWFPWLVVDCLRLFLVKFTPWPLDSPEFEHVKTGRYPQMCSICDVHPLPLGMLICWLNHQMNHCRYPLLVKIPRTEMHGSTVGLGFSGSMVGHDKVDEIQRSCHHISKHYPSSIGVLNVMLPMIVTPLVVSALFSTFQFLVGWGAMSSAPLQVPAHGIHHWGWWLWEGVYPLAQAVREGSCGVRD